MDNEVKKLYSALIGKGYTTRDLGDEQTFMGKMQDADNRKQLYDWVNARGDFRIGSYDDYEKRLTAPPAPKAEEINPTSDVEKSGNTFADKIPMVEKLPQIHWTEESIASPKLPEIERKDIFRDSPYRANYEKVKAAGDKRSYEEWLKSLPKAYDNDDVVGENGELLALVPKEKVRSDEYGGLSREQAEFLRSAGHNNDIDAVKALNRKDVRDQVNESYKEITDAWSTTRGIVNDEYYGSRWYGRPLQVFNKITSGTDATDFTTDKDVHAMRAADKLIGEAKSVMDAATEGKGFFAGAGEVLSQWNPVKSLEGLIDADAVESAVRKIEEGKELSYAENALLESFALNAAAHTYYEDEVSNLYNAGKVVGDMIPLAAEMLANPASGMARKWAQATLKRVAGKSMSKATKKALMYAAGTTGAFAGGTTMAATTGLPSVLEEAQRNSTGRALFDFTDGGDIYYAGVEGGGAFGDEVIKSLYRRGVENATEQMGAEWLTRGLGKVAGKVVAAIPGGEKAVKYATDLMDNKYAHYLGELAEKVNYQGPIEEFVEEIESAVLGVPVDGMESLKEFFDGDNLITTAIAVSVPGFGMGAINAIGGVATGQYKVGYKENQKRMQAYGRGMEAFADNQSEWNRIVLNINSSSVSDVETELKRVYHSPDYTDEQKQRVLEYAVHSLKYRTLVEAKTAMTDDTTKKLNDMLGSRYSEGYEVADEQKGAVKQAYDMERERVLNTFGEEVVQRLDDDPAGALMEMNEVDRQEAIAYVNARTAYEGMIDRISDDIDERVKASDKEIDSHKNRQDGAIHPAMMRGVNGAALKRVYIVNGNVATFEDGTIDKANSSSMIIVRDAETGEVSAASADDLESLEAVIDTEAEKKSVAEQIANEYAGQQAVIIETEIGTVEGENGVQPVVAPVVEDQIGANTGKVVESSPTGEAAAPVVDKKARRTELEKMIPVKGKKKQFTEVEPAVTAEYISLLTDDVAKQVAAADKYIAMIQEAQQKADPVEALEMDEQIAYWESVKALLQGGQPTAETAPIVEETQAPVVESAPVEDNTPQSQSDSSPTLVEQPTPQATNEMQPVSEEVAPTAEEVADAQAFAEAVAQNTVEAYQNYLDKFPEGAYRDGARNSMSVLEGTSSVADIASISNAENVLQRAQAAQEADLESAEKGQNAVEPVEENNESTLSQTSDQVGDQVVEGGNAPGQSGVQQNESGKMYSPEELAEAKEQLGELNATSAPEFAARLFSIKPWKTLEEANAALKELLASYGETLNGQSLAVMPFLDKAQGLIREYNKSQEPRSVEEVLENGDKRITNYNSRGEVATVATERDGKVVSVDSYDEGVLFEHTEYDGNGVSTSVTRYNKQGNVIGTTQSANEQENTQESGETAENGGENAVPEWLNKVPDDGRNFFVYVKFAGENKYQAIDLGKGETVDRLVRATMLQKEQLQALVEKLPSVLLEDAEFQIRDAKGNIYYNSGKVAAGNEVAKQEDKEVAVATEDELDIYLAEMKAAQERQKAFAQKTPPPSFFVKAYTENDAEAIKKLDKQFNDVLQTLVPMDIPAIEATIKGMKERKRLIKDNENPNYKALDHIEKALAKRKKQLEKELTEDDKRRLDIIKRGNRGELKETPQPKQENKPVESEPIKDEAPVTSETTEQPETGEVADTGPVNVDTLQLNMSEEDFNALLNSGDKAAISEYLAEMDGLLRIGVGSPLDGRGAIVKEYRGLVEQYGGEENIPADVVAGFDERIAPYNALQRAVFDRKYALQDKLREIEASEAQAKEQAEKEAKAGHKKTAFGGFLAGKSDVGASTAEKALGKRYKFDDGVHTVAEYIEQQLENGTLKIETREEPKYKGVSRQAWNRMDARQQAAEEKRVKEGGMKTVYSVNNMDLGKTAYDYAKFLLDKKAEQEKASQGERSKGKTESESKQGVEKIEDVGEVLAGARKDALKVLASSFENATVKSLIELPFSKAFKKPDLKKAVESGALREEDALFYEAMFNALINSSKPKNSARHRNAVETWAEETYNSLQLIKSFVEADEAARDRAMAEALEDKFPAREEELAVIEKRKVWNARNNAEWGDKTTPNPVWVAHEVLKALGYKPGDKVEIPFGVLKANVFATGYEFYNKKGERLIMQSVPTVEEGIENIVWLSKIKRGDADIMHPMSSFFATPTKRDMGDSGRYYVLWGTVRNPRRNEFGSIEEANAFAAGHKEAVVRPIQEVVKRYGYKLIFREPITGDKFFVNDMEFETEGEAMQYLEDNYDAVNEQTNELLAKERGEAKKEVSADDLLEVAMVRGKEGWKYAVNIKGKYANNMGMPLLLREFDTREDAKAFLNESKNEVFEIYKKQQAEQKKFVFFDTGENSRIGEDYRGGRDVTAKDFMDTFGFRGVQFGNWTNQEDRQMAVNQAFDAFMDLAKLLGVSPKALSLNGELGMAFGSRGSGFGNAHYELGEIVINLTKTRGAGSLAHEWWHALDNYFARRANVPMGMVTDSRSIDMRPELRQAYNKLLKMIEKSDFYKRSKAKGDYWGRMHEVTARLMAEWVDQSLKDRGELNTFLSRGVNEDKYKRMNYDVHRAVALIKGKEALSYEEFEKTPEALAGFPYPSRAELKEFGDAMRNIFETVEEQETEEGDVVLYRSSEDIEAEYPNWLEGTTTDSGKHSTQVEGTRKTYKKVGDWIEENMGKDVAILDASSGMGYGTADLRERGFDIEDVEPYQSAERKQSNPATYSSYGDIEKQYDYIISNAVLNVIPDNWRADLLHEMVDKLKVGGKLFINTRKAGEERSIKDKIELDSPQEVLVKRNGRIASYQRFFTPQELKEWVESELGDGYTVEIANKANSGTNGLAAVVVTKNEDVLYRLTGEKGAAALDDMEGVTTRMDDLVLAKEMEARGYEPWVIEVATKWRRIKNGQWRYDLGKKKRRNNDRELYNSDLTTEEKRAIQKYIESLPENYASEHPLAFENNGYIYIFNTSRLQYEDNRTDKHDGFNIISKYDLNNIPNEKQNLLRKILGGDIRTNDRVVGEFETWRNDNQSDSMYSAGATAAMEANGVDGRVDKNSQADRGRDTGTGFENEQAEVNREGAGPLTDREVVMESDPYSKVLGKPRYYGKRQREFVARQRRRMAEKARQVAEKLNLDNVEVLESTEGLTGKKATSKGWFDPKTGKITVVVPNHGSTGDIVETVLHEAVAHYGLRKLFGENFNNFLDNVYNNVTPEIRAEITELAKKHGWDFHTATEEYLASLAENTNFEKVNPSLWSNIKSFFMKMLAKVGITLDEPLGDNELRYILWRSHQNLVNPGWFNVFGQAEDIAKQYELGVGNYASGEVKAENGEVAAEDDSALLHREGGAPGSARKEYERKVRRPNKSGSVGATENVARRAQEAYQDSMLALKILQDAVARETGNEVKDNENAYIAENRMSSSNKAMVEIYERDFFMPLMDEINTLIKEGVEYDDIIRYLHAKHGLERNEYMRRKQAEEAAHRELGEEPAMPNEGDADYEAKVNAKAAWRANLAELTESYVKKFAKRDYSGLTALTETANAKAAEAAAQQMVDEFENDHDTTPLWEAVNKATKETLRREFAGGLIDRATYDTVSTMFDFYIPLRGWDENVAANEYEYFTNNNTPVFTPAIKTMHGRKSLSDDPIATIGYMAGSAIARANRNLMKQKFLNFVMNNPTSLATVSEQWYTMDYGTNEWVPNNPAIPEDATPEQVVEIVEAHEANMRALEKAGLATRERSGLKIGLHATKQEEQQHVVRVMRNGKEYAVYINGNPRAAQALNGMTNPDVSKSKAREAAQNVKNFMARAFTSRNPAFIISNSARDVIWAGTAVAAKEDAEYTKQYTKNVTGVLAKFKLPRLLRKFRNGTLDMNDEIERYFDEFLRNGGETGFTQVLTVEDYKKNIARFTKEAKNGTSIPKKAWRGLWNGIEFLNRSAEDITRFTVYMTSRQMGRSIARSVYDAKEITVNFNKKGSGEMGARYLNFAYIFFNATIQSLANFGKLVYRHPGKMAAALGTFGMMGFLMPVINAALMAWGDDDDMENYWNLPEWVRRNNIVLFVPWTEKDFITIPLPHELRPFYGMGENAMSALLGKQTIEDAIKKSLVGFTGMLPIDFTANGGDVVVNVMPTILQPFAQVRANVTHFGTPIYKDNDFNKRYPSWTKAYKGTNSTLVAATKWLNELGGGNNVDSGGLLDWNPAVIEHLFESYLGGMGKTFNKAATTVSMLWDEEARIARNIPVASSFYQESDERTAGSQLNREYFNALEEMEGFQHRLSGYQKEITKGNAEYEKLFEDLVNPDEFMRYGIIKDYSNAIRELDQVLKNNNPTEEEAQEIEGVIQELKKEMLDELEKLQAEE